MSFRSSARYFPARRGFWVLLLLAGLLFAFFREATPAPSESEAVVNGLLPLVRLLLQMGVFLLAAALGVSILSTLIAWFTHRYKSAASSETLELSIEQTAGEDQYFQLVRTGRLLPFWGNVQTILYFREEESTHPVALQNENLLSFSYQSRQRATGVLRLRHTKEYKLESVRLFYRDAFGLFALPVTIPASDVLLRTPDALPSSELQVMPRRATELTERVDTMQRVEGDLYNSRRFASGDDMRRILWSVYARNRELIVRIPEIFEPYASVLTVFAAFKATLPATFSQTEEATQIALDFYKSAVWTVYNDLSKGDRQLQFQLAHAAVSTATTKAEAIRQAIAAAHWEAAEALPDSKTQVIVLSSLLTPEDLVALLDSFSGKRSVVLVRLSEAFNMKAKGTFLSRLIFRSSREGREARLQRQRSRVLAAQLRQREEKLLSILHEYDSLAAQLPEKVA